MRKSAEDIQDLEVLVLLQPTLHILAVPLQPIGTSLDRVESLGHRQTELADVLVLEESLGVCEIFVR